MPSARTRAAESITRSLTIGDRPPILVRTLTGLERLVAGELTETGHDVIDISIRQLTVRPRSARIVADPPRSADDLFLIGATLADPGRTKAALESLVRAARQQLASPLPHCPGEPFAVSASFLGRRTYSRFDIEDRIGAVIAERTGARYHSRRRGVPPPPGRLDWRVVLDGGTAHIAVRPFDTPLHRRSWRRRTVTGSLHPPLGAALARLARIEPGHRVLDPFCGAGTVLFEAQQQQPGAAYLGIDRDPAALDAARANTPDGTHFTWKDGDAGRLDPLRATVDRIITNPPWEVRLGLGDIAPYLEQWRRALRPRGCAVALLNREQADTLLTDPSWHVSDVHDVSVAGQHPRIVIARPTA